MNFFLSSQNDENLKHVAGSAVVDKFGVQPDLFHVDQVVLFLGSHYQPLQRVVHCPHCSVLCRLLLSLLELLVWDGGRVLERGNA